MVRAACVQWGALHQGMGVLSPLLNQHHHLQSIIGPFLGSAGSLNTLTPARGGGGLGSSTEGVNHFPWQAQLTGCFAAQQHCPSVGFLLSWAERWDKPCPS